MLNSRNKRRHGTGNLKKDLFLGHLLPLDKNLEDIAILILEFDDVTVQKKTKQHILFPFFSFKVVQFVLSLFKMYYNVPSIPDTNRR